MPLELVDLMTVDVMDCAEGRFCSVASFIRVYREQLSSLSVVKSDKWAV